MASTLANINKAHATYNYVYLVSLTTWLFSELVWFESSSVDEDKIFISPKYIVTDVYLVFHVTSSTKYDYYVSVSFHFSNVIIK